MNDYMFEEWQSEVPLDSDFNESEENLTNWFFSEPMNESDEC